MFDVSVMIAQADQDNHLPFSAVFFEVDRNPPKGYPVTERKLRHFTVPLPLLSH